MQPLWQDNFGRALSVITHFLQRLQRTSEKDKQKVIRRGTLCFLKMNDEFA